MITKNLRQNTAKFINLSLVLLVILNTSVWLEYISFQKEMGFLKIYVLDVGQGDAILIKTPNNQYGLIDTSKGTLVLNELEEVLPYGLRALNFVVLTHPDADHIEGALEVLKRYRVEKLFINKIMKLNPLVSELINTIQTESIQNYSLFSHNDFELDQVIFDVVWPISKKDLFEIENSNDQSISLKITYRNLDIFMAGDLSFEYEETIAEEIGDIDLLKVSHHGSKTSSSKQFLAVTKPEIALISLGLNNSYGHPHEEVLTNFSESNIEVMRTDLDKRIEIETNGENIKIQSGSNKFIEFTLK